MYHLLIITPEEPFFEGDILSLIVPGNEGYLGILKDHSPLMTHLQKGIVTITNQDHVKSLYEVSEGFFKVKNNRAVLLVETIKALPQKEREDFR